MAILLIDEHCNTVNYIENWERRYEILELCRYYSDAKLLKTNACNMKKKLGAFLYFIYLFTYSGKHKWGGFELSLQSSPTPLLSHTALG